VVLADWPVDRPSDWVERVNEPTSPAEIERWPLSLSRSRPFGDDRWVERTAARLGLEHTIRPGRERREPEKER
jgi:hypothetical protein